MKVLANIRIFSPRSKLVQEKNVFLMSLSTYLQSQNFQVKKRKYGLLLTVQHTVFPHIVSAETILF